MADALPFIALDLVLAFFAIRRPWAGLILLLGGLAVNGAVTQVIPNLLSLSEPAQLALAGWHDALVVGIALAAGLALFRAPDRRLTLAEWLIAGMLALGAVFVLVSPVVFTAMYVYRVLYEPPLLLAAITVLARTVGVPSRIPGRAALAIIGTTTLSALFAGIQVYVLSYAYIQKFFTEPGQQIHHSFLATGLSQPRAIGLAHSPNEFGASLAVAIALLVTPGLVTLRDWQRSTLAAALVLALLISYSRSGWLATIIAVSVVLWLSRDRIPSLATLAASLRRRGAYLRTGAPAIVTAGLMAVILTTSGGAKLVVATANGTDPSAVNRPVSVRAGLQVVRNNPLGLGLGTAGPKAARFGEQNGLPRILTETWYILYAIQVGIIGLGLLAVTAGVILRRLWLDRLRPVSRTVIGIVLGLGAGAVFIPIIEDPAIYTPLWALAGMALAVAAAGFPARPAPTD